MLNNEYLEAKKVHTTYYDGIENYDDIKVDIFLLALLNGVLISQDPTISARYERNDDGPHDKEPKRMGL
jgi:hypothetical protein